MRERVAITRHFAGAHIGGARFEVIKNGMILVDFSGPCLNTATIWSH